MLRDGSGFVPKADTVIQAGDEVLLVLDPGLALARLDWRALTFLEEGLKTLLAPVKP